MKISVILFSMLLLTFAGAQAAVILTAKPDAAKSTIALRWNMADHYQKTAYVLLKSFDGVVWQAAAANPVFRNYTSGTIMIYNDTVNSNSKIQYQVKIYDPHDKVIALSNRIVTELPKAVYHLPAADTKNTSTTNSSNVMSNNWNIFRTSESDFLFITYRGSTEILGVMNVLISDAKGKTRVRFRQASNNPHLKIPIANLQKGPYRLQLTILNEKHLDQQFIKR